MAAIVGSSPVTTLSGDRPGTTSAWTVSVGTRSRRHTMGCSCSKLTVATWFSGTVRPFGSGMSRVCSLSSDRRCSSMARPTTSTR